MSHFLSYLSNMILVRVVKKLMPFLFVLIFSELCAQGGVSFSGIVVDGSTGQALERTLLKVNGELYLVDEEARFSLSVVSGDIVVFHHLGYTTYEIVIGDSTRSEDLPKIISLQIETVTLDEVEVSSYVLTDEMRRNAQYNVQQAMRQVLSEGSDTRPGYASDPSSSQSGSGLSSSQMIGFDVIGIIGLIKDSKKEKIKVPTKKIMSYEEYRSSISVADVVDTVLVGE